MDAKDAEEGTPVESDRFLRQTFICDRPGCKPSPYLVYYACCFFGSLTYDGYLRAVRVV